MQEICSNEPNNIIPVKEPAVLHDHVRYPDEQWPPPFTAFHGNAIQADVLVASVHTTDMFVLLLDQSWLFDVHSAASFSTPPADM